MTTSSGRRLIGTGTARQVESSLDAEIALPHVRAQLHSFCWPEAGDRLIQDREQYYLSRSFASDKSTAQLSTEGSRTRKAAGSLAVHPPKFPVRVHMAAGQYKLFMCVFEPAYFEEVTGVQNKWDPEELGLYFDIRSSFLGATLKRIQQELEKPGFASSALVDAASTVALIELTRWLKRARRQGQSAPHAHGTLSQSQLRRVVERIAACLEMGSPSLRELAALCSISQSHLMRAFKASTGTTVHKQIENARITMAKKMLAEENISTKEIAFRLDFSSATYFSAAFRRATSMTPREFRSVARGIRD